MPSRRPPALSAASTFFEARARLFAAAGGATDLRAGGATDFRAGGGTDLRAATGGGLRGGAEGLMDFGARSSARTSCAVFTRDFMTAICPSMVHPNDPDAP
ncbi:MAG TPA: hypothetical protein VIK01_05845 [Polyangiaceae bacterium]